MTTTTTPTTGRHQIIREVRRLMPSRAVEDHEARALAERQSQVLRHLVGIQTSRADLDAIASLPRLNVRLQAGLPVSGFSEWNRSRWTIAVNRDDHYTRRRFTLAHEVKHVLDHPYIDTLYPGSNGRPSEARAEAICDYFAACLLMPRTDVKRLYFAGRQHLGDLAAHFGVSRAAMAVRLQQLGLTEKRQRCHRRMRGRRYSPSHPMAAAPGSGAWT